MILLRRFFTPEIGENVIRVERAHWFVIAVKIAAYLLLTIMPVALILLAEALAPSLLINLSDSNGIRATVRLVMSLYYFFLWFLMFYEWLDYYLDIWIVTNHRIIEVTQRGFFNHEVSEIHLSRIQDMMFKTKGIFSTFLDFGDIHIQTAGATERVILHSVGKPRRFLEEMNRLMIEAKKLQPL